MYVVCRVSYADIIRSLADGLVILSPGADSEVSGDGPWTRVRINGQNKQFV